MLLLVSFLSVTGNELIRKNDTLSSTKDMKIKNLDMQDSHFVSELDKINFIPEPLAIWFLQYAFDLQSWSGALGNAGAEFAYDAVTDKYYFYSTRWASDLLHRYEYDPILGIINCVPFQVSDGTGGFVSGLRDLAYDGTYFYGGTGWDSKIYEMDFTFPNPHLVSIITDLTGTIHPRAIAYDPTLNSGNGGFYVSAWDDPVWIVSRSGNILGSFNLVTTTSTYGFAYDDVCGGRFLWVFDQGSGAGTPQYIRQWDLISGGFTPVIYDVNNDFSTTNGVAGGLFFTTDFVPGYATLGGCLQGQPDIMFCYEICPYSPCCLKIVDVCLVRDSPAPNALCNNIEVEFKNDCGINLNDIDLTMTFTVDLTRLCPCGGGCTPFLIPPVQPVTGSPGVYQRQWTGLNLASTATNTKKVKVEGWAYFNLVVTLTSATAGCSAQVTKTGFTGNLLS